MVKELISFIREIYNEPKEFVPLHEPCFVGNEKKYITNTIDTTFVSSVGKFTERFEKEIASYTGAKYAIAVSNGTSALHVALMLSDVKYDDEVLTQPLTFIATCNAISYIGAKPVFVDVSRDTMGLCPHKLKLFLEEFCEKTNNGCLNKKTNKIIKACVPMHTFGFPCEIDAIAEICAEWGINLVEDSAESLGSYYKGKHTGTYGKFGAFSFNGNKTITCGGGGALITNDEQLAKKAKHVTTTAKVTHAWDYYHDEIGYNYRMPNINAALVCAQLEQLPTILKNKKETAKLYSDFFKEHDNEIMFKMENEDLNYWLNCLVLHNRNHRNSVLKELNDSGIMSRPIWTLMHRLPMFKDCFYSDLSNSEYFEDRVVNIPSSVRKHVL